MNPGLGAQFTCFTSTKVQILTQERLALGRGIWRNGAGGHSDGAGLCVDGGGYRHLACLQLLVYEA